MYHFNGTKYERALTIMNVYHQMPGFIAGGSEVSVYEKVQVTWKPQKECLHFFHHQKSHKKEGDIYLEYGYVLSPHRDLKMYLGIKTRGDKKGPVMSIKGFAPE